MGRAAAEVFVREGAKVLAADISGQQEETAAALGDAVLAFHVDVSDEALVVAMFAAALKKFGKVDAVLNVAGIAGAASLADLTVEEFDRFISVNLVGVMLGTKHGIRTMLPTGGGAIVNWSSTGGMNGSRLPTAAYSAGKAGVISITKVAAIEYGTQGIRANTICPGFVETAMSGGTGGRRAIPRLSEGLGPSACRPARGSRRARIVSFVRPRDIHHRCRHCHRRRQHLHAPELTQGAHDANRTRPVRFVLRPLRRSECFWASPSRTRSRCATTPTTTCAPNRAGRWKSSKKQLRVARCSRSTSTGAQSTLPTI